MISGCLIFPGINKISNLKKDAEVRTSGIIAVMVETCRTSGQHFQTRQFVCIMQGLEEFANTQGIVHLHVFKC